MASQTRLYNGPIDAMPLVSEALKYLQAYIASGLAGFARKAHDRLQAAGYGSSLLGQVEDWDAKFAADLYAHLAN